MWLRGNPCAIMPDVSDLPPEPQPEPGEAPPARSPRNFAPKDWHQATAWGLISSFVLGYVGTKIRLVFLPTGPLPIGPSGALPFAAAAFLIFPGLVGYAAGCLWRNIPKEKWDRYGAIFFFLALVFMLAGNILAAPSEWGNAAALTIICPVLFYGIHIGRRGWTQTPLPEIPAWVILQESESRPPRPDPATRIEADDADLLPFVPPMRPRDWRAALVAGNLFSLGFGFVTTGLTFVIGMASQAARPAHAGWIFDFAEWTGNTIVEANFLVIPFGMGFVASYFWREIPDDQWRLKGCGYQFVNFLFAMVGCSLVLLEGAICLWMAAPLVGLLMWAGNVVGRRFWKKNPFLGISVLPALIVALVCNAATPHYFLTSVTTNFHSAAAPAELWRYTANYPANPHPADWYLWRMGLPMPVKSVGRAIVGGRRDCDLTGGADIGERVVVAIPNRELEFVLRRGRIELIPDGHGGTWLRGTSWYQLKVFPTIYFNWWASQVVHNTHRRVFQWMDELARRDEAAKSGLATAGAG